ADERHHRTVVHACDNRAHAWARQRLLIEDLARRLVCAKTRPSTHIPVLSIIDNCKQVEGKVECMCASFESATKRLFSKFITLPSIRSRVETIPRLRSRHGHLPIWTAEFG